MSSGRSSVSARQRDMLRREQNILAAAETILVNEGFLDMTIARISAVSKCPRSTIYLHFASRQDIVVTLAYRAWQKRLELMERGVNYAGPPRIRMAGVAVAFALFYLLYPEQVSVLDKATETICEKASPHRLESLRRAEQASVEIVRSLLNEAVLVGDLKPGLFEVREMIFGFSALAAGGFSLQQMGFPKFALDIEDAQNEIWRAFGALADVYGWRPLSGEIDWDETLAEIRRQVFPEETQLAYGPGAWYGGWGAEHPRRRGKGSRAARKGKSAGGADPS